MESDSSCTTTNGRQRGLVSENTGFDQTNPMSCTTTAAARVESDSTQESDIPHFGPTRPASSRDFPPPEGRKQAENAPLSPLWRNVIWNLVGLGLKLYLALVALPLLALLLAMVGLLRVVGWLGDAWAAAGRQKADPPTPGGGHVGEKRVPTSLLDPSPVPHPNFQPAPEQAVVDAPANGAFGVSAPSGIPPTPRLSSMRDAWLLRQELDGFGLQKVGGPFRVSHESATGKNSAAEFGVEADFADRMRRGGVL